MLLFNLMEQDWFISILATLVTAITTGLSALIAVYFRKLIKRAEANETEIRYSKALEFVNNLITQTIGVVNQTFVDQLKKDKKFDPEAQKEAFKRTFDSVVANMTVEAKEVLDELYGDGMKWIQNQIEYIISTLNK